MSPRRRIARLATLALLPLLAAACAGERGREQSAARAPALSPREGYVTVEGGRVWYRIVGSGTGTPVLLLHGGPGVPSNYLKPLTALADDRPVIYYDQLGTGKSDHPTDSTLWTTARFVRELATVRDSLGLDEVHLYGHSWGTMLAAAYMETKPAGVKSVTFASPCLSAARWQADADTLIRALPDSMRRHIATHEAAGTTATAQYQAAMSDYYSRFVMRTAPPPADAESSMVGIAMSVYGTMWGPSEFAATGNLKSYDATPRLHEITVPTLFTAGEFDEATPSTTRWYASLVPGSRYETIPGAAHMVTIDNAEETVRVQREFLRAVDGKG
jgi:proline iminopeptidase